MFKYACWASRRNAPKAPEPCDDYKDPVLTVSPSSNETVQESVSPFLVWASRASTGDVLARGSSTMTWLTLSPVLVDVGFLP